MSDLTEDPETVLQMGWLAEDPKYMDTLQCLARRNARDKGFYPPTHNVDMNDPEVRTRMATHLALVHAEVSEALEELRPQIYIRDKFAEELADVLLRLCDIAEAAGISLADAALKKMEKNLYRPNKHGKVF